MTDLFEFQKSQHVQNINEEYNTYIRKDYNYLNDTNSSVYSNNGLTLVQFDLSSIYNSSRFTSTDSMFVVIPLYTVAAYSTTAGALVAPDADKINLVSLKNGYHNLIHQADIAINGRTLADLQPFCNVMTHLQLMSEMSENDLKTSGRSYGLNNLDNEKSVIFESVGASVVGQTGQGFCNNRVVTEAEALSDINLIREADETNKKINTALMYRNSAYVNRQANTRGFNSVFSQSNYLAQAQPTFSVSAEFMKWTNYCVIKIGDIMGCMDRIGLTRRFDGVIRLYLNTGTSAISCDAQTYSNFTASTTNFTGTSPFTINHDSKAPTDAKQLTVGCFVGSAPTTSITTAGNTAINLGLSNVTGIDLTFNNCRMYYTSIELDPRNALSYVESNRAKRVVYRSFITNTITGVNQGASFSQLIQSGLTNPVAVVIIPYVATSILGFPSLTSPYNPSVIGDNLSITNLQVTVGGVNQLNNTLFYNFESFITQVGIYEQTSGNDFGVNVGLLDQNKWTMGRSHIVNIRSRESDMNTPRNINISFTNNTVLTCDYLVYCVYLDQVVIDVETGRVTK